MFNFLSRLRIRYILAPPGVNPLEEPIAEHKKRLTFGTIFISVFVLMLCASTIFAIIGARKGSAKVIFTETPIPTITKTFLPPTMTSTKTLEPTYTPSPTFDIAMVLGGSLTPSPNMAIVTVPVTQAVIHTVIVRETVVVYSGGGGGPAPSSQNNGGNHNQEPMPIPILITVQVPVTITIMITSTPGPTHTPWIITPTPGPTSTPWVVTATPGVTEIYSPTITVSPTITATANITITATLTSTLENP